jgi:hypothetical protein
MEIERIIGKLTARLQGALFVLKKSILDAMPHK